MRQWLYLNHQVCCCWCWPKLFYNLWASRQTELTARFPLHVVCGWIGNSAPIADKHYLQITDDHYADAVTIATPKVRGTESGTVNVKSGTESGTAGSRNGGHELARNKNSPAKPSYFAA